jgi:hypothetical protein
MPAILDQARLAGQSSCWERLHVPLRKRGKQVSIGFSIGFTMTMEQLMSVIEPGVFNC